MSRTVHLMNWMGLLFSIFYLIFYITAYQNELVAFDEWCLQKQVNYASDSAVEALLDSGHTEQDYLDGDYARVEPDMAVQEFTEILGHCFDYTPTVTTNEIIQQQYVKALLVCTHDGVYAYWMQPYDTTNTYKFVGSPKIPYFYTDPNGVQYALTLGLEKGYRDAPNPDKKEYNLKNYDKINVSKDVQLTAINNEVSEILNYALVESYGGKHRTTYDIPGLASEINGKQIVDKITVIGIVEGRATSSSSVITAEGIGGAQIITNDPPIGIMLYKDGKPVGKVYAKASRWEKISEKMTTVDSYTFGDTSNTDITKAKNAEYFDMVFEAAKAGYSDWLYDLEPR